MHDARATPAFNGGEPLAASQSLPSAESSPVCAEPQAAEHALSVTVLVEQCRREIQAYRRGEATKETFSLELLHHAIVRDDQDAWRGVQQCFDEIVRSWLHCHPKREAAYRLESEEHYVAAAFERFWQAIDSASWEECNRLSIILRYLYASLNGAVLDTLRVVSRPQGGLKPSPDFLIEPQVEDLEDAGALWTRLQQSLPNQRSQRLAYLLFHCGLSPREIVQRCPHEFRDVQEISRLQRSILEHLLRNEDYMY